MTSLNPGSSDPGEHSRPRKVAIVFNPASGGDASTEHSDKLKAKLEEAGVEFSWFETTPEDGGKAMARQAVEQGAELVIAAGGDGTVMACATALSGTDVPLAVVPFGTGNLVAANFDIPTDMDDALEIALECRRRRIDLGSHGEDRFVIAAGMGIDAAMLRDTDKRLKARVGPLAYVVSALKSIRRSRVGYKLAIDDQAPVTRRGQGVMVCNLGRIQGGLPILPDAVPDDGLLDVGVFRTKTLRDWAAVAISVIARHHGRPPELETFKARKITVRTRLPQPVQFDGDTAGPAVELDVEVAPSALTLAVPAHQVDQSPPVRRHPE
jgi:YegS/Rv2252/BmrU family lipid kinase